MAHLAWVSWIIFAVKLKVFFKQKHGPGLSAELLSRAPGWSCLDVIVIVEEDIAGGDDTKIVLSFGKLCCNYKLEVYELCAARGFIIRVLLFSEYTIGEWFSNGFKRKLWCFSGIKGFELFLSTIVFSLVRDVALLAWNATRYWILMSLVIS